MGDFFLVWDYSVKLAKCFLPEMSFRLPYFS